MTPQEREARETEIETAAYALLAERGFAGASMLNIARRAKASNETMYRWYGDKTGLFAAMVRRNAARSAEQLRAAIEGEATPLATLRSVAPVLLGMVLGERAIALNRAAASDATGTLGRIIHSGGRERLAPLLTRVIARAAQTGELPPGDPAARAELFIALLLGDRQIRRVIGALPAPGAAEVAAMAEAACSDFIRYCKA